MYLILILLVDLDPGTLVHGRHIVVQKGVPLLLGELGHDVLVDVLVILARDELLAPLHGELEAVHEDRPVAAQVAAALVGAAVLHLLHEPFQEARGRCQAEVLEEDLRLPAQVVTSREQNGGHVLLVQPVRVLQQTSHS